MLPAARQCHLPCAGQWTVGLSVTSSGNRKEQVRIPPVWPLLVASAAYVEMVPSPESKLLGSVGTAVLDSYEDFCEQETNMYILSHFDKGLIEVTKA